MIAWMPAVVGSDIDISWTGARNRRYCVKPFFQFVVTCAPALLCSSAAGQSLNIDFQHSTSTWGTPLNTYSAGGGAGVWHALESIPPGPLSDLGGTLTPVELSVTGFVDWDNDTQLGALGSTGALLNDALVIDANALMDGQPLGTMKLPDPPAAGEAGEDGEAGSNGE